MKPRLETEAQWNLELTCDLFYPLKGGISQGGQTNGLNMLRFRAYHVCKLVTVRALHIWHVHLCPIGHNTNCVQFF